MRPTPFIGRALLYCALIMACAAAQADTDKTVYGFVENARLEPWGVEVKAKLDSGALTSSMHATDIEEFERDGKTWVRFKIRIEDQRDEDSASSVFERPLYRVLKVTGAGGSDRRPVVLLNICMNDTVYEEQFSLRDRGDMIYPMLLGRRTIRHLGLLDVEKSFLHSPKCDNTSSLVRNDPGKDD